MKKFSYLFFIKLILILSFCAPIRIIAQICHPAIIVGGASDTTTLAYDGNYHNRQLLPMTTKSE